MKKILILIGLTLISLNLFSKIYTPSEQCIKLIQKYEKCVLQAYPDAGGWTIGWGHHGKDVYKGMVISKAEADEMFKNDMKKYAPCVNRLISALPYEYEFSQGFIDGLFSLVYNCGENGVKNTPFYQRLLKCRVVNGVMNEDDFNYTLEGVKISKIPTKHHVKRRLEEYNLMIK